DAACALFGIEPDHAIGKRLDERVRGLDWKSLTRSGGAVSHDLEIFYPNNRFINFYIVPLLIEKRDSVATPLRGVRDTTGHRPGVMKWGDEMGSVFTFDTSEIIFCAEDWKRASMIPFPSDRLSISSSS